MLNKNALMFWKLPLVYLTPLLLLPIPLCIGTKEANCCYVVILMAMYWITEAVPLAATALLPVVLFPLMGIMDSREVTLQYMKETNMMFLGGLIVAIAIEHCNLHMRIALKILLVIGTSPRLLLMGIMITTMFLSMWISNTSTVAMMLPITKAILSGLNEDEGIESPSDDNVSTSTITVPLSGSNFHPSLIDNNKSVCSLPTNQSEFKTKTYHTMLLLGTAYAANLGGTGTLTGSGTNAILAAIIDDFYGSDTELGYATWMIFNVPLMLVNTLFTCLWLQFMYMGFRRSSSRLQTKVECSALTNSLKSQYEALGEFTFHELLTSILFVTLVLLWFFRDPKFMPGWKEFFPEKQIGDSVPAIAISFLLFSLPSDINIFKTMIGKGTKSLAPPRWSPLLPWKVAQSKLPWNIIFLMGGGYALAKGFEASGLSALIGQKLHVLESLSPIVIIIIITIATSLFTEVVSNSATANVIIPILAKVAESLKENPLYLTMPAAVACSYAFMLPVGTPPNAIVYAESDIKISDMAKTGIFVNFMCIFFLIIATHSMGYLVFDFNTFPTWAALVAETNTTNSV